MCFVFEHILYIVQGCSDGSDEPEDDGKTRIIALAVAIPVGIIALGIAGFFGYKHMQAKKLQRAR